MQMVLQRRKEHPEHSSWSGMRQRCNNPKNKDYARYGGRGVKVCERWNDFTLFLEDMGGKPSVEYSLDRLDNNGSYEPNNCHWATPKEQTHNSKVVKLNAEKVNQIRKMHSKGAITQVSLAIRYNIHQSVISRIINGKIW